MIRFRIVCIAVCVVFLLNLQHRVTAASQPEQKTSEYQQNDTTPPTITLLGNFTMATPFQIEPLTVFNSVDPGYIIGDNYDAPVDIVVTVNISHLFTSVLGLGFVEYTATDTSGNFSTAVRFVNVVDTQSPIITLFPPNPMIVPLGGTFIDPGASAYDIFYADLTDKILVDSSAVLTNVPGMYDVIYGVQDPSGNIATTTRQVIVLPPNSALLAIEKVVVGMPPAQDWTFTINQQQITLPAAGGKSSPIVLPEGNYTITETEQPGYVVVSTCYANHKVISGSLPGTVMNVSIPANALTTCVFENRFIQPEPAVPECPAGYTQIATVGGYSETTPPLRRDKPEFYQQTYQIELAAESTLWVSGHTMEGHPEAGCSVFGGIEEAERCNQRQAHESYNVLLDGVLFGQHLDDTDQTGENVWLPAGPWITSAEAGTHHLTFAHTQEGTGPQSVSYEVAVCAQPLTNPQVNPAPINTPISPGEQEIVPPPTAHEIGLPDGSMSVNAVQESGLVQPTFIWTPASGDTASLGEWINIVVADTPGNVIINVWRNTEQGCTANNCYFSPGSDLLPYGLANGAYTWYLRSWANGIFSTWSEGSPFIIAAPVPALPILSVNISHARPVIVWQNDPNTAVFDVAVFSSDGTPIYRSLHDKREGLCVDAACNLPLSIDFVPGEYQVYMQAWGAGGFSTGGTQGWASAAFTISHIPPTPVTGLQVISVQDGRPTLRWDASNHASTYELVIVTPGPDYMLYHTQHYLASDLGCTDGAGCQLIPDVILPSGNYLWFIRAAGPGGYSSGGIDGWIEGPGFSN